MNDDQVFVFAMTMLICATCVAFAIVGAFVRRRKAPPAQLASDAAFNDRLDRMEHAIDTIAVEVERVSEAQRFVTKVLAERKAVAPAPPAPERVITPH